MTRMVYTVTSHSTWYDRDGEENERGQKRHDAFELVLAEHEVPQTTAVMRKYWVFYPSERAEMESFRDVAFRISWVGEACRPHDVEVEISTLYARCPYCGKADALHDKNWLIYEDAQSRSISQCGTNDCIEAEELIAVECDGWLPVRNGSFRPLLPYRHPFADAAEAPSPWERFIAEAHQAKLLSEDFASEDFAADGKRHTVGLSDEDFQGLYECPCCQGMFQVHYRDSGFVSNAALKACAVEPLIDEVKRVHADIISDERFVTVTFEPGIGELRIRSLRFDLEGGSLKVDGVQLFKGRSFDPEYLRIIPSDVHCDALSKTLTEILCEYKPSTKEAIETLTRARKACEVEISRVYAKLFDTKLETFGARIECGTFLDLAIANRYRGYPQEFYRRIYGDSEWDGTLHVVDLRIRKATSLPADYSGIDIENLFGRSGLLDCKSVRRRVFSQPLLLAGVLEAGYLPFTDQGILTELFDHEEALDYLEVFSKACCAPQPHTARIVDYLIEHLGQLKTWFCMKKLGATKSRYLVEQCPHSFIESLLDPVDGLSTSELVALLADLDKVLNEFLDCSLGGSQFDLSEIDNEKYRYTSELRRLEGVIEGVSFCLPESNAEMIRAGWTLHNCLRDYAFSVWSGKICIVFMKKEGRLVGAIMISVAKSEIVAKGEVIQVALAHNKPISREPGLEKAYELWLQTHGLTESPW